MIGGVCQFRSYQFGFLKTAEFFIVLCVKNYISTRSLRREGVGFLVFVFVSGVFT